MWVVITEKRAVFILSINVFLLLPSILLNQLFSRDFVLSLIIVLLGVACAVVDEIKEEVETVLAVPIAS